MIVIMFRIHIYLHVIKSKGDNMIDLNEQVKEKINELMNEEFEKRIEKKVKEANIELTKEDIVEIKKEIF